MSFALVSDQWVEFWCNHERTVQEKLEFNCIESKFLNSDLYCM